MVDEERSVWVVRHGKHGEDETEALSRGLAIIGWEDMGAFEGVTDYEEIRHIVAGRAPNDTAPQVAATARQLFAFACKIQEGDMVVLPLKSEWGEIAVGDVTGGYGWQRLSGVDRHVRLVDWSESRVLREDLPAGLRRSISSPPTVYRVGWTGAANHLEALLKGRAPSETIEAESSAEPPVAVDPREEILDYIREKFRAEEMERLVAAVLQAQGYVTRFTPKSHDGGIDVLAGRGPFGLEGPRFVVEVKARQESAGIATLRGVRDAMSQLEADHALIVSWSGYSKDVEQERRREHFRIRLWNADDLLDALLDVYDKLPETLRKELPLKQVWTLDTVSAGG